MNFKNVIVLTFALIFGNIGIESFSAPISVNYGARCPGCGQSLSNCYTCNSALKCNSCRHCCGCGKGGY